jgi:hypothetical protein
MNVTEADKVVSELTAKHAAALAQGRALADERRAIAFRAHTGDAKARKRLDEINFEDAVCCRDVASLAVAVAEGQQRQAEARQAAAIDAQHARANEVLKCLAGIRGHGVDLDKLACKLVNSVAEFRREILDLRKLGIDRPDIVTIDTNFRRALRSALMATPMQIDHLAPHQRTSFAALVDRWAEGIERWAKQQLEQRQQDAA